MEEPSHSPSSIFSRFFLHSLGFLIALCGVTAVFALSDRLSRKSTLPGLVAVMTLGTIAAMIIGYSIWSARRHRNRMLAVVAPFCGIEAGATALGMVSAMLDQDQEIAPFYIVLLIVVVYGVPLSVLAIISGLITIRVVRGRWGSPIPGHCPQCDYDLSGLHAAVCPECGADTSESTARVAHHN
jgi:prepilin signal peptidase PulO-like enzyme (type II secretory pathway)